jgi:hypothetical protein
MTPSWCAGCLSVSEHRRRFEDWTVEEKAAYEQLYIAAENAAAVGLPEDVAHETVREGYSSIAADRDMKADP